MQKGNLSRHLIEGVLIDSLRDLKGSVIWTPFGLKVSDACFNFLAKGWENLGYSEWSFPIMNIKENLECEETHIKGFSSEIFWIQDDRHFLSPTGESVMYPYFSDKRIPYPLRVYQKTRVFRKETNATRALWRSKEFKFLEFHSFHILESEALEEVERQVTLALELLEKDFRIKPLAIVRPPEETFPGAVKSIGLDVILESGYISQIGSIHFYGQNFSRAYNLKTPQGGVCFQTTCGFSERLIGVLCHLHSTPEELRLPLNLQPENTLILVNMDLTNDEREYIQEVRDACKYSIAVYEGSMKQGMELANKRGSRVVCFIGAKEVSNREISILHPNKAIVKIEEFILYERALMDLPILTFENNSQIRKACMQHLNEVSMQKMQGSVWGSQTEVFCEICEAPGEAYLFGRKL